MENIKLSVIIPSCKDPVLQKTIDDIRRNFKSDYELIVVFDGYKQDVSGVDIEVYNDTREGLRSAVNKGVAEASGEYLLKIDEHCRFDNGFDIKIEITASGSVATTSEITVDYIRIMGA